MLAGRLAWSVREQGAGGGYRAHELGGLLGAGGLELLLSSPARLSVPACSGALRSPELSSEQSILGLELELRALPTRCMATEPAERGPARPTCEKNKI